MAAGNAGMEGLIPMVNKLQDAFATTGGSLDIDLPQIAVVGGQSAGKSSVLENFVGKDFLPRGSGIVTRRPLVLQLMTSKAGEWGEFLHCPNKKFTDFGEVRREIEAETDRMTGSNKGISSVPINLRVYSPHVLNLTLVDLPGMTKVPVGDQPPDIELQIKAMISEFVSRENCLILAVSPANTDLANSDALKIAKEFDPQGTRTIGVITKLDLMDEGTDARSILENKHLPLRRGYVGVVNRSQKDITNNKDIRAALNAERQYFQSHPAYRHMVDKMGTAYLQKVLNQQLTNHIKSTLPQLKKKLATQLREIEKDVESFKDLPNDKSSKIGLMLKMVQNLNQNFIRIVEGHGATLSDSELLGGAKINIIFHGGFAYEMTKLTVDENQLRKDIKMCIQNVRGIRSGLFTPDQAFEEVVRGQITKLKEPAIWCVEAVSAELTNVLRECSETMKTHPALRDETDRIVTEHVKEQERRTKDMMQTIIDTELAYVDTHHQDFIGHANSTVGGGMKGGKENIRQNTEGAGSLQKTYDSGTQVLKKGWLVMQNLGMVKGGSKEFWFVLDTDTLSWYKDDQEDEKRYSLSLENLRLREVEKSGFFASSKPSFVLFHRHHRNIYKDKESIELSPENQDILQQWSLAFFRAGVMPVKQGSQDEENVNDTKMGDDQVINFDPTLDKRVENIRNLVDSYMHIVMDNIKDIVPKIIMALMVNKTKDFLRTEIQTQLLVADSEHLMEEAPEEEERRKILLNMYQGLKEALRVLSDINLLKTETASLPPPVDNSWIRGGDTPGSPHKPPPPRSASPSRRFPPQLPPPQPIRSQQQMMGAPPSVAPPAPMYQQGAPPPPIPNRPGGGGSMRARPALPRRPNNNGGKPAVPQRPR